MKNYTLAVDQLLFSVNSRPQPTADQYYHLGMAYYYKGEVMLAKQTLRKSLEVNPSHSGRRRSRRILNIPG